MRQIGTIPKSTDPKVFGDHLLGLGVTSRVIESKDGWDIWVHDEDLVPRAREEFSNYQNDPENPKYQSAGTAAEAARREAERLERDYQKNVRSVSHTWNSPNFRRRPLTLILIYVSIAVFVALNFSTSLRASVLDNLLFFSGNAFKNQNLALRGLDNIGHGQLWRLVTPIFIHFDIFHIVFNVWAVLVLGTLIEYRRGTLTLTALAILAAIASNVGQYLYVIAIYSTLVPWGGMSGVVYAFFGYVWMKGQYEPEQGMILHPSTVRIMLLWLLLGFTGVMPMANGAHLVGLIVGILFGLARF